MPMTEPKRLETLLGLRTGPVALKFQPTPPSDIPRVNGAGPAGCTYWKRAAEGQTFYTEAADHYNCPIGAYTHGIALPPEQLQQLQGVVGTMTTLGYIRGEEVPGIPRRQEPFGVAVYGPLTDAAEPPDVVLV